MNQHFVTAISEWANIYGFTIEDMDDSVIIVGHGSYWWRKANDANTALRLIAKSHGYAIDFLSYSIICVGPKVTWRHKAMFRLRERWTDMRQGLSFWFWQRKHRNDPVAPEEVPF